MPEWRSWKIRRIESHVIDGVATTIQWEGEGRFIKFNIDRTTLIVFGLVIAEIASWIDRYA